MNDTNGTTRTCGLIGNPVAHSISPVIHNHLAALSGINLVYVTFPVEKSALHDAVKGAYALDILGLNVTVPYKSDVIPELVDIDPLAKQIGAVNTLVRVDGGFKGYNTDMPGLYRAMCSDGVKVEGEKVLVLGAGGAARANAFLLAYHHASEIIIMNRTIQKAQIIADAVKQAFPETAVKAMALNEFDKLSGNDYICIQATSVGLHPNDEDVVIADLAFYKKLKVGYDVICNPVETKFMKLVKEAGGEAHNGLKMLLYQGILAYELWNQCNITEEDASFVFRKMKEAMGIHE
ncbi:MAG: shikimate dehydrogenase [Lachnospiraceae bacterium]|nr:shikimate dehydrogenase [Lachnospiraceae bacterium]